MLKEFETGFETAWLVEVQWNTDHEGRIIEDDSDAICLYGPFYTEEAAIKFMHDWPDGDTDVHEISVIVMNLVKQE